MAVLFSNMRDERNVLEWVSYHLLLGFDKIIIFDHASKIPIGTVFHGYKIPQLEVHRFKDENMNKGMFMGVALNMAKKRNASWLLYLDADEYLVLRNHTNIRDFLKDYDNCNSIGINWVFFGSNYLERNPSDFLINDFIRCSAEGNKHVKTIAKISAIVRGGSPHHWLLQKGLVMHNTAKQIMPTGPFNNATKGIQDPAYIHHYYAQSYETYMDRKIRRTRDDIRNQTREDIAPDKFHKLNNENISTYLRDTYSKKIKEYLQTHKK